MKALVPRTVLAALELFTGIGAVYGAAMLVTDAWHLPSEYLDPLPVHGWVLPGVALLAFVPQGNTKSWPCTGEGKL